VTRRQFVPAFLAGGLVFVLFAFFAAWRSPVPGVNEPHYLCKAKHFWDPGWCARDQFLSSADAHWAFYATIGSLTRVLSLEDVAWIGRLLVSGGLAFAWVRLSSVFLITPSAWLGSACLFLALLATGNLSGEWILGGVEAKGFAYVALILVIAAACRNSYREAAIEAGLAISLHPVIGVWGLVSLVAAWTAGRCMRFFSAPRFAPTVVKSQGDANRSGHAARAWTVVVPAMLCLTCSLPGLLPAAALLTDAPSRDEQRRADELQVFDRLNHHLDPTQFSHAAYRGYAGLLAVWLVLGLFGETTRAQRFMTRFILATLVIALAGLLVGFKLRMPGLMKFYPFRLFDVFLPMAVAIMAVSALRRVASATQFKRGWRVVTRAIGPLFAVAALAWSFIAPGRDENAAHWQQSNWNDFVDACRWIEQNVPAGALCLTPRYNIGFKWYAQRAEYVTWKDCPQDAAGILEWKRRLDKVARWRSDHFDEGFSATAFARLHHQTRVDYVLAWNADPWRIEPIYRNRAFSVYKR
jgi:hypothetical protein